MAQVVGYRCSLCNAGFLQGPYVYLCQKCGGNLDVVLDIDQIRQRYQKDDILSRTESSMWRYLPLLPVAEPDFDETPIKSVGWTPVYSPPRLKNELKLESFWIKDEGKNPTASFKDRASAIVVARAREVGAEVVVTASTGNAGAALAGMSAAVGQKAVIFAPKNAPPAKVAQLLVYGAQVILVEGNYDQAFDLSVQAAQEFGWYCRNTGFNPYTLEGKKTAAFEIWEQLGSKTNITQNPLCVFVSVGDGNIISGLHKGFKDLFELGWIEQMPRLFGVQSEKSSAVANAYFSNSEIFESVHATTLADSISVDLPRDGVRAARAARKTNGAYLTVSDEEIIQGIGELGIHGIFTEPAGSTAFMGLKKALQTGIIQRDDPVVVINTGNGLKDIQSAMKAVKAAPVIEPDLAILKKFLKI